MHGDTEISNTEDKAQAFNVFFLEQAILDDGNIRLPTGYNAF